MTATTKTTPITHIKCDTKGCQANAVVMGGMEVTRKALTAQQGWACDHRSGQDFCPKCSQAATESGPDAPKLIVVQ